MGSMQHLPQNHLKMAFLIFLWKLSLLIFLIVSRSIPQLWQLRLSTSYHHFLTFLSINPSLWRLMRSHSFFFSLSLTFSVSFFFFTPLPSLIFYRGILRHVLTYFSPFFISSFHLSATVSYSCSFFFFLLSYEHNLFLLIPAAFLLLLMNRQWFASRQRILNHLVALCSSKEARMTTTVFYKYGKLWKVMDTCQYLSGLQRFSKHTLFVRPWPSLSSVLFCQFIDTIKEVGNILPIWR